MYESQEKCQELSELVTQLQKEKEEMKEYHSLQLQKLRIDMRQQSERYSQELLQTELEHKVQRECMYNRIVYTCTFTSDTFYMHVQAIRMYMIIKYAKTLYKCVLMLPTYYYL